jgi:MFS family permease
LISASCRTRLFYGWYVLAASFVILFFNAGARFSFGVIFKPMIEELGWSRSEISAAFFLNTTVYAISLVAVGRLYDRYGPKWVLILSSILLAAGFAMTSVINAYWQFLIGYGLLAAVGLGGTSIPLIAALMSKWFERWRGLAISLALSGNSVGQFVLIPLFSDTVAEYGWRPPYLAIALIMLGVNVLLAAWVIKGDPHDLGQAPFGQRPRQDTSNAKGRAVLKDGPRDMGLREAMRTRSFWLFNIAMFICGSGDFLTATHLIPMVTDFGVSSSTAGSMLAWYGLLSLLGMLVAGPASDVLGNKIPIALTFALRVLLFLLIIQYQTPLAFYAFALAFGFTYLITAPLTPTLIGRLYGFSHVGILSGFITTIHHLGGGFWTYLGGWIFDETGSYHWIFVISAGTALVAVLCTLLIAERRHEALKPGLP